MLYISKPDSSFPCYDGTDESFALRTTGSPRYLVAERCRSWNEQSILLREFFYFFATPLFVRLGREHRNRQHFMSRINGPQDMSPGVGPQLAVRNRCHYDRERISREMENRGFVSGKQPA